MIIVVVVSFSTKSHTHEEGGGDVESADEWSLSHLISNASAMKSTTKSHKAMTCTHSSSPSVVVVVVVSYCKSKLFRGRLHISFCVWLLSVDRKRGEKKQKAAEFSSRSITVSAEEDKTASGQQ